MSLTTFAGDEATNEPPVYQIQVPEKLLKEMFGVEKFSVDPTRKEQVLNYTARVLNGGISNLGEGADAMPLVVMGAAD